MAEILVKNEYEFKRWGLSELGREYPKRITVKYGNDRSTEQNRLLWKWNWEAAQQLKEFDANGYHAYCKLHIGVPILREDDDFREFYDETIKGMTYEKKMKIMERPGVFSVTSLMTTKQMARYMDAVYVHYTSLGALLTEPEHG